MILGSVPLGRMTTRAPSTSYRSRSAGGSPADVMRRIRAAPPASLGGFPVETVTDFTGADTGLPPSDALRYTLRQARVVIRPSGTEPKIKAYLEVVEPAGDDLAAAREAAAQRMAPLRAAVTVLLTP